MGELGMNKTTLLLGASLFLPLAAFAGPSYNYIQGDYVVDGELEIEGAGSTDFDGWNVKFSGAILPHLFIQGEHTELDIDNISDDQDFTSLAIGGNFSALPSNSPMQLDVFGTVSYELLNDAVDADGYGVTVGLRFLPIERIEISPFVGYVDYGQIENFGPPRADLDGLRYGVEAIVKLIDCLALTASYRQSELEVDFDGPGGSGDLDFSDQVRVGLRLYL